MKKLHGAWPALLSPKAADGSVNVTALRGLIDYLLGLGADGLYVGGSTGEGVYMSVSDRRTLLEETVRQVNGRVPVVAHIGTMASADAIGLAQHADQLKVDGISSIIPPNYGSLASTKAYFAAIADAAPNQPLLPYLFGAAIDAVPLMRELMEIPSVAGTKYTGPNMYEFRAVLEMGGADREHGWTVFSGMDEQCVFAAMFGSSGNIGSTLNFMLPAYKAIHQHLANGDFGAARDLQLRANKATGAAISFGFMGALYAIMGMLGVDCGEPRLPSMALTSEAKTELRSQLEEIDFFALARGDF